MTKRPTVVVFCEGSPGNPHDRFTVAAYRRAHATPTPAAALWIPLRSFGGIQLRPAEQIAPQPDGSTWLRFTLRCDWCRLDDEHKAEPGFIGALFTVFDSLWFSGTDAIEARELVRRVAP